MRKLIDNSIAQINNSLQGAISSNDIKDLGEEQQKRYTRTRQIFTTHLGAMRYLFEKLESLVTDMTEFESDIASVDSCDKLFEKLPES